MSTACENALRSILCPVSAGELPTGPWHTITTMGSLSSCRTLAVTWLDKLGKLPLRVVHLSEEQ